jgi:hypothetical protein
VRLTEAVTTAVGDAGSTPAAVLALTYAESIDEATHAPLGLAVALERLAVAASIADEQDQDGLGDTYGQSFRKVAAALSAVSVASDLGPKLLAALDALLITPKARAAVGAAVAAPTAGSPLDRLRERHDGRGLRSVV